MKNLFKSPKAYIMLFSVLYFFEMIINTNFLNLSPLGILTKILNLLLPLSVIVYLIAANRKAVFNKYILPFGFGLSALTVFIAGWQAAALSVYDSVFGTANMILTGLQAVTVILMFLGTLFDFENVAFLKWGSLLRIAARTAAVLILGIVSLSNGGYGINILSLISFLIGVLFYFGIFLLAKEKSK